MPATYPYINSLLMHRTVGIVLTYLNCHMYTLLVVVVILVGQQLVIAGYYNQELIMQGLGEYLILV